MISYYFGGKNGILQEIVSDFSEGINPFLDKLDLDNIEKSIKDFRQLLEYLEEKRLQVKILFSEIGKGSDQLSPIKKKISELQNRVSQIILGRKESTTSSVFNRKLKIVTDIMLGMIFSDFTLDLSSFQEISDADRQSWREERLEMIIRILQQISGISSGKLTFDTIF
jgi:AcrR family transcriptional regulator